eukprot:CAMPEP_0169473984 /NCGR_PEP_ID=MMETSP1042-20121227/26007_1 /TAXON_ID=464988 /ORGANISM="Hemiselmis andersenii, Strain CCMP1180" /LENGTH=68 /DNA_ID=CAMNT_0009587969 /DNA_START=64 /DNA_END=267 /DNA_ORIENTATION=-
MATVIGLDLNADAGHTQAELSEARQGTDAGGKVFPFNSGQVLPSNPAAPGGRKKKRASVEIEPQEIEA